MGDTKKTVFFPNLNGLRFLAAFMVILHHFELSTSVNKQSFYGQFAVGIGKLGVVLFFTLSGFLITYLLLEEKSRFGFVDIKRFYARRILRIWPLYYLIVIGALYVFNDLPVLRIPDVSKMVHEDFIIKNFLFIFMLPNVAYAFDFELPFAQQTWSIGVEEQFYIFWPFLFARIENLAKLLFWVIGIFLSLKLLVFGLDFAMETQFTDQLYFYIQLLCFDSMALGGLAAWLLFSRHEWLKVIFSRNFQIGLYLVILVFLIWSVNLGMFKFEFFSVLFALLILNLAANSQVLFTLEGGLLNYLGKISYGLYMYHFLALRIAVIITNKFPLLASHWLHLLLVVLITTVMSAVSYEFFEKYFIKMKFRFSPVPSGVNPGV